MRTIEGRKFLNIAELTDGMPEVNILYGEITEIMELLQWRENKNIQGFCNSGDLIKRQQFKIRDNTAEVTSQFTWNASRGELNLDKFRIGAGFAIINASTWSLRGDLLLELNSDGGISNFKSNRYAKYNTEADSNSIMERIYHTISLRSTPIGRRFIVFPFASDYFPTIIETCAQCFS